MRSFEGQNWTCISQRLMRNLLFQPIFTIRSTAVLYLNVCKTHKDNHFCGISKLKFSIHRHVSKVLLCVVAGRFQVYSVTSQNRVNWNFFLSMAQQMVSKAAGAAVTQEGLCMLYVAFGLAERKLLQRVRSSSFGSSVLYQCVCSKMERNLYVYWLTYQKSQNHLEVFRWWVGRA